MPDYKDSKIYKITCNISGLTYYGSTIQPISKRMGQHRSDFKKNGSCNSKLVLAGGDYDYCLVEKCPCDDKSELHRRERFYIETNECVNKTIPGRTLKEWYLDNRETLLKQHKEYKAKNKEKIKEDAKKYYLVNKEKILEQTKVYRAAHKEENSEYMKAYKKVYNSENKEKIAAKAAATIPCECGCIVIKKTIARHRKSQKHIKLMSQIEQSL